MSWYQFLIIAAAPLLILVASIFVGYLWDLLAAGSRYIAGAIEQHRASVLDEGRDKS